jgi:hypothetical protein
MFLSRYTERSEPTPYTAYTEDDDDPTWRFEMSKSDAIWEAQERARMGNHEATGVWLLVAGEL